MKLTLNLFVKIFLVISIPLTSVYVYTAEKSKHSSKNNISVLKDSLEVLNDSLTSISVDYQEYFEDITDSLNTVITQKDSLQLAINNLIENAGVIDAGTWSTPYIDASSNNGINYVIHYRGSTFRIESILFTTDFEDYDACMAPVRYPTNFYPKAIPHTYVVYFSDKGKK